VIETDGSGQADFLAFEQKGRRQLIPDSVRYLSLGLMMSCRCRRSRNQPAATPSRPRAVRPEIGQALAQYLLDISNRKYRQETGDSRAALKACAFDFVKARDFGDRHLGFSRKNLDDSFLIE
jgi:hypothetical protein